MAVGWGQAPRRCQHSQPRRLRYFGRCATAATQAGGGSFVPDGTWDKATREPSDQSLGYFLSPSGLDGGSPASKKIVSGSGKTGLLAANVLRSFPAFIFKNALAAYNGNWGACRFSKAGGRLGGVFTRITRITNFHELGRGNQPQRTQRSQNERLAHRQPGYFTVGFGVWKKSVESGKTRRCR